MKRLVQIPRWPELRPLPVMERVFDELTAAFVDYGCTVRVVRSLADMQDGGIAFLDDSAGHYLEHKHEYIALGQKCPNTVFVCWYWWKDYDFKPFRKTVYTGEYYICPDLAGPTKTPYITRSDFVPLKLRANEDPRRIGSYARSVCRDFCYMGGGYRLEWVPTLHANFSGLYHQVFYDNYMPYEDRKNVYLSSTFSLAFQSDVNINLTHLSQRVFEGLAYGCVVLCENPMAAGYTDGAVVYFRSLEDLVDKMRYFKANSDALRRQQQRGYEWSRKNGTNRNSAAMFIDGIRERFGEAFENAI